MFDELKIKSILKKEITEDIYLNLSSKIKEDSRVVDYLIRTKPNLIGIVSQYVDISKYILKDYKLIDYLNEKQLNKYFEILDLSRINVTKELFDRLYSYNRDKIFKIMPNICLSFLDEDEKISTLLEIIRVKIGNEHYSKFYNIFNDDELKDIILNLSSEELKIIFYDSKSIKKYIIDVIVTLDEENIEKFYPLLNGEYELLPLKLQQRIDLKNANDDLKQIIKLSSETQVMYFLEHMNELLYADRDIIEKCLSEYNELTADILLKYKMTNFPNLVSKLSMKETDKLYSRNFYNFYANERWLSYSLDDIMDYKFNKIIDINKKEQLKRLYSSLSNEPMSKNDMYRYHNEKYQISKLLYDEKILENNDISLLEEYKNTYSRRVLIEILSNAYGEHVREILRERPQLNLFDIDNFKIFDKKIYDKLGNGFIHYLLNNNLNNLSDFVGKIVLDELVLNNFANYFNCMIKDVTNLDINVITNVIEKYILYEDIIKEIDFNNINDKTKRNLELFINDDINLSIGVNSSFDIGKYSEIRKSNFIKFGRSMDISKDLKDLMFSYVFGRSTSDDMVIEKLSFEKAIQVFDIDTILTNEEIKNKMNLSREEVAMLVLFHEINRIYDLNVLKNVFESLVNKELNSVIFENTFNKIKSFYVEDIKNNLLSTSKLEKMSSENIEGVEVATLDGEDFTLICSVTGLNLSSGYNNRRKIDGRILLFDWLTRERGYNNISTAIASSDTSIYPIEEETWNRIEDNVVFVFDSDVSIIGVGATDISSDHIERSRVHTFEYIGEYGKDVIFTTMTELKNRINKNARNNFNEKGAKFDSEITITRREEDIRKDNGGSKRTMPIAMYVVGEIKPEYLEIAKIFNEYYEKNNLGKFRIIKVNPSCYKERTSDDYLKKIGDDIHGRSI